MRSDTTGTVQWFGDHYKARLRLPDPENPKKRVRPWVTLEKGLTERQAKAKARRIQALALTGEFVPGPRRGKVPSPSAAEVETLEEWVERWHAARKARGRKSTRSNTSCVTKWVLPRLGKLPVSRVTREDIEAWVEWIDHQVLAGKLSWKTAHNAWGLLSKMFGDARGSKTKVLRVRKDDPTADVEPPERGVQKGKQYLYPNEFLQLVTFAGIALQVRRCYALTVYFYLRSGELEALGWEDVDLDHGAVHVHRAMDYDTGTIHETKGKAARRFELEPAVLPLLRAMRAEAPQARLVFEEYPPWKDQAGQLRKYLKRAGVERAELYVTDATRKAVTFHDLRATGTTWAAVRGDEPLKIMHRAGHKDLKTTMGYVREAENLKRAFGAVFPELPGCLLGSVSDRSKDPSEGGENASVEAENSSSGRGIRTAADETIEHDPAEFSVLPGDRPCPIVPDRAPQSGLPDRSGTSTGVPADVAPEPPAPPANAPVAAPAVLPVSPRAELLLTLADSLRAFIAAADLEAAMAVHAAMGKVLGADAARPGVVHVAPTEPAAAANNTTKRNA